MKNDILLKHVPNKSALLKIYDGLRYVNVVWELSIQSGNYVWLIDQQLINELFVALLYYILTMFVAGW